jgi:putative endonuclease
MFASGGVMREEKTFFVYMMSSRSRVLYLGVTSDLHRRVWQHKNNVHPKSFAAQYKCTRLVWYEEFSLGVMAIPRETQMKKWNREKKVRLIEAMNPTWEDLAEEWYK